MEHVVSLDQSRKGLAAFFTIDLPCAIQLMDIWARSGKCHPPSRTQQEYNPPVIPARLDQVQLLRATMRGVRSTYYQQCRLLALVDLYESIDFGSMSDMRADDIINEA
ncbi:PREDICTED: uncharacterized protein LOC106126367 isoform X2 [Papilio xuthus]|nr:PREDICTED: uncharacterized protein LOC106126367 isoform X2 [Papilio xuthus]